MPKLARPKAQREPRILSPPYYRGPIPCVAGPKLHEFKYRNAAIEFLSLLSDPDTEGQAHVFEVRIRSQIYALKVVRCSSSVVRDLDEADLSRSS